MNAKNETGELPPVPSQKTGPGYADQQPINLLTQSNTTTDLQASIQNAEKFVALQDSIRKMAVKVTSVHDWLDEGGNPYLQEHGAQKIAMCFGVSIQNVKCETENKKDDKGEYVVFNYTGEAIWQGRISPQIGTGSSRDPFFGKRNGKLLPLSEVNLLDVRKKAMTNLLNRAIKSCLGLSYTWDELSEVSEGRISQQTVIGAGKGVSYNKGSHGGSTAPKETQKEKDKKGEVWDMLVTLYGNETTAGSALEKATSFTNADGKEIKGKSDISKVTIKQINFLYKQIKEAYDKHTANMQEGTDFTEGAE